jgi:hypothetical protein
MTLSSAPDKQGGGAAYVFVHSGGAWSQQAELTGAFRDNSDTGAAYVFASL